MVDTVHHHVIRIMMNAPKLCSSRMVASIGTAEVKDHEGNLVYKHQENVLVARIVVDLSGCV